MPSFFSILLVLAFLTATAAAQTPPPADPGIQDNSFLVEEAYNQEFGVVQHISSFSYLADSKDWVYSFTQEWPAPGIRHQLSYTLTALRPGSVSSQGPGVGDVVLNYRYQMVGTGDTRVAFAPRFSLILPSGNSNRSQGAGATGYQTNLPLSIVLNRRFVTHWNAGATFIPHARNADADRASVVSYNLGQSVIWQTTPRFNVMMETFFLRGQGIVSSGKTEWTTTFFLNPGIRWAYNFKNGLQIVPGIAMPIGVGPSYGEKGVFVYLSFEHPFRKLNGK
jgi:hypothetical protein